MGTDRAFQSRAFTMVELLVVITIVALLSAIALFSIGNVRSSARDDRRRADLAAMSSSFEKYRADCGQYPPQSAYDNVAVGASLNGSGVRAACGSNDVYLQRMPGDPANPGTKYAYTNPSPLTYVLCAALESPPSPAHNVTGCGACGDGVCNYAVRNN